MMGLKKQKKKKADKKKVNRGENTKIHDKKKNLFDAVKKDKMNHQTTEQ